MRFCSLTSYLLRLLTFWFSYAPLYRFRKGHNIPTGILYLTKSETSLKGKQRDFLEQSDLMKAENLFNKILYLSALMIVVLLLWHRLDALRHSIPSIKTFGVGFFASNTWDAPRRSLEPCPFSWHPHHVILAILLSIPFSISISIFLGELLQRWPFLHVLKKLYRSATVYLRSYTGYGDFFSSCP